MNPPTICLSPLAFQFPYKRPVESLPINEALNGHESKDVNVNISEKIYFMNIPYEKPDNGTYPPNCSLKPVNLCCFAPAAKVVQMAGDFNQWHPILMKRKEDGWWFIQLWLPYGRHRYRFLLDGEPILDWHASGTARDDHNEPVSFIVVEPPLEVPSEKRQLAPGKSSCPKATSAFGDERGETIRTHFFTKSGAFRQNGQPKERS